jgi:hypothetical protein
MGTVSKAHAPRKEGTLGCIIVEVGGEVAGDFCFVAVVVAFVVDAWEVERCFEDAFPGGLCVWYT